MKRILLFVSCLILIVSCECPKIEFTDKELTSIINAIKQSEVYMKKIPALPNKSGEYATFGLSTDTLKIIGSTYKYNPNDSTRKGRINIQAIDTCTTFPGLTQEEFIDLKKQLNILKDLGVCFSQARFYNDGKFRFYCYVYSPVRHKYYDWDFYLAVFEDPKTTSDPEFLRRFNILDKKGQLYLMTYH